jgi:hypothetical protein
MRKIPKSERETRIVVSIAAMTGYLVHGSVAPGRKSSRRTH